ncbi:hypothetical protein O181_068312 [Austropuccinia psidii MF-1]|uniref:Integrase catalytic domain-containing protein n=1 Tax=Austropuccinia psidii MF-1 TaxID=1389203 RepID=A0A9Q3I658_9BASI|nr:hypothetical protein [Austropuccinia psidii MF-1]
MDWVTALPPGGHRSFNICLVLVDRYSKTGTFLPYHKDETAMDTAIMIWIRVISHTGFFKNIISDGDPKFTSALWKNLHNLFGTKLSFSKAYHAQTYEFKHSDGFTQYWCTLRPALELSYKTSIHSSTGKTQGFLEKGWNPRLPYNTLKKDVVDIHPTASNFKIILEKERHHANICMQDHFKCSKERWDKIHKPPYLKVGDFVLVSTLILNNIKGPNKFEYSFSGPFMIRVLHGLNPVQLELTGDLMNKHPVSPVSMMKPYS